MKNFFLILISLYLVGCVSNQPPELHTLIKVHNINLEENQIFEKALQWMAENFNDSKSVIEYKNPETGTIIGKGGTEIHSGLIMLPVQFTMKVEIKKGKYRVTFDDYIGIWPGTGIMSGPKRLYTNGKILQVKEKLEAVDLSLNKYLNETSNSEW